MSNEAKRYGLILGAFSILSAALFYLTGMSTVGENNPVQSVLAIAIMIVLFILAARDQKKRQGGYLSYGEGFKTMLGAGVISTIFSLVWVMLLIYVLEPGYVEVILDNSYEQMMEQNPNMSDAEVEMALGMTEKFVSPGWMVIWILFGGILSSAFFAALMAMATSKKRPPFIATEEDAKG